MSFKDWNIEALTGYKPKTTFYMDFSIADKFGVEAIRDTYQRAFESWHEDIIYFTELVMVLNWKIYEHYESNTPLARLYEDLYFEADRWAQLNLEGEQLEYYYTTTD